MRSICSVLFKNKRLKRATKVVDMHVRFTQTASTSSALESLVYVNVVWSILYEAVCWLTTCRTDRRIRLTVRRWGYAPVWQAPAVRRHARRRKTPSTPLTVCGWAVPPDDERSAAPTWRTWDTGWRLPCTSTSTADSGRSTHAVTHAHAHRWDRCTIFTWTSLPCSASRRTYMSYVLLRTLHHQPSTTTTKNNNSSNRGNVVITTYDAYSIDWQSAECRSIPKSQHIEESSESDC